MYGYATVILIMTVVFFEIILKISLDSTLGGDNRM